MSSISQYKDEAEWLKARATGLGASDAAAVCGLDPWRTPLNVYEEKLGLAPPKPDTPAMQRGRLLESVACDLYAKLTSRKLRRQPLRRHPSYDFILCSVDRQIIANGDDHDGPGILEVKSPGLRAFSRMKREGLPAPYICQLQHSLGVWDYTWGSYAVFSAELWSLLWFDVKRDDAFVASLFEQEIKLWNDHIVRRVPPPPLTKALAAPEGVELPAVEGAVVQRDDVAWTEAAESYKQAVTLRETAELVEEQAKGRLKELLGGYGVAEGADLRVYYRQMPGRKTLDKKALVNAKPLDPIKVGTTVATWAEQLPDVEKATYNVGGLLLRLAEDRLDLGAFDKVGKNFDEFRAFRLRPETGDEDD